MQLYENKIDSQKFRFTNGLWNELKLNSPLSVGYVTTLIESRTFSSKEEWRNFYFESGAERLKIAKQENLPLSSYSKRAKELQSYYGRTEEELRQKGKILYDAICQKENPLGITLAECIYMVKFRVIGETWNGVVIREHHTVQTLQKQYPSFTFHKVDGKTDFEYAIDYEVYEGSHLLCAIQIKPFSYKQGTSPEILQAKKTNLFKNNLYEQSRHVQVLYVYSNTKGDILNPEILPILQQKHSPIQTFVS